MTSKGSRTRSIAGSILCLVDDSTPPEPQLSSIGSQVKEYLPESTEQESTRTEPGQTGLGCAVRSCGPARDGVYTAIYPVVQNLPMIFTFVYILFVPHHAMLNLNCSNAVVAPPKGNKKRGLNNNNKKKGIVHSHKQLTKLPIEIFVDIIPS